MTTYKDFPPGEPFIQGIVPPSDPMMPSWEEECRKVLRNLHWDLGRYSDYVFDRLCDLISDGDRRGRLARAFQVLGDDAKTKRLMQLEEAMGRIALILRDDMTREP